MPNNTIGEAYIQIKPSMEGVSSEIEKAMGDAGASGSSSFGSKFTSGLKTIGVAASAAVGAAAAGVSALTKTAVSAYADFEQLSGGIETLFGEDMAQDVFDNANEAFKTAGLSANEYMETVTGFSASLISSLGEHSWQAANYADLAIVDMADNANKMGSSMESIQNAYQGFAKQNYTMLDNLKLGYGGTKEEMERLLRDAEELEGYELGSLDISNFADIVEAIHIVQENLGIAGATEAEAASTISGSIASMQSAWTNLVAGFANGDADLGVLIDNLVNTATTALDNLMPAIERGLVGIADGLVKIVPVIADKLPALMDELLPPLIEAATSLFNGLLQALPAIFATIIPILPDLINTIVSTILTMLPQLIDLGMQLLLALADGIIQNLPTLIPAVIDVILTIVDKLTDPDTIVELVNAAIQMIMALAQGLLDALPVLIERLPEIINNIVTALIESLPLLIEGAIQLVIGLVEHLPEIIAGLIEAIPQIIVTILGAFGPIGEGLATLFTEAWNGIKEVFSGVGEFFSEKWNSVKEATSTAWDNIKSNIDEHGGGIKGALGAIGDSIKKNWQDRFREMNEATGGRMGDMLKTVQGKLGNMKDKFLEIGKNAIGWGKDMIDNFVSGIKEKFEKVKETVANVAQTVKDFLGFSEPDKGPLANFHTFAPDMLDLFSQGITQNISTVREAMGSLASAVAEGTPGGEVVAGSSMNRTLATDMGTGPQVAAAGAGGGTITIPVYIGQNKIETIVVDALTRANYRAGGR